MGRIKLRELQLGFRVIGGERRTVYEQLDGNAILNDECTCRKDPFTCPIDKHGIEIRMRELDREGAD